MSIKCLAQAKCPQLSLNQGGCKITPPKVIFGFGTLSLEQNFIMVPELEPGTYRTQVKYTLDTTEELE